MPATTTPTKKEPFDIYHEAIREALAPVAESLREAFAKDEELHNAAAEVSLPKQRERLATLEAAAIEGDSKAYAEIEAAGGSEAWLASATGLYSLREGVALKHTRGMVPAVEKMADAIEAAMKRIDPELQSLWENALAGWRMANPGPHPFKEQGERIVFHIRRSAHMMKDGHMSACFHADQLGLRAYLANK